MKIKFSGIKFSFNGINYNSTTDVKNSGTVDHSNTENVKVDPIEMVVDCIEEELEPGEFPEMIKALSGLAKDFVNAKSDSYNSEVKALRETIKDLEKRNKIFEMNMRSKDRSENE